MRTFKTKEGIHMLLEFSFSNHKSINKKVHFSMLAGHDKTNADKLMTYSNERVLRSAILYGANGSGKSNFVDALTFMKFLVKNSLNNQLEQLILQSPHKLCDPDSP
ncbi:MAG: ATP-binding protein, partial [Lachnoclostridium sp.]|nr:ATP-binding protein [Lachnoclostridium sp.]